MAHAILVIEGDATLREAISSTLRREGYFVLAIADASLAEDLIRDNPIALIVLDLLPLHAAHVLDFSWKLCSEPAMLSIPTLILVDHAYEIAQLESYGLRATDYLLKPRLREELCACARTLLSHTKRDEQQLSVKRASKKTVPRHPRQRPVKRTRERELVKEEERILVVGDLWIDLAGRRVMQRNQPVEFKSALLFNLLVYLIRHRGIVLSCEHLLTQVWGYDGDSAGKTHARTVYVHMHWLRELLGDTGNHPHFIQTVRGVGYRFQE
jgi:two-component system alkaline phosphatase synthesis response regulator PhoP